MPHCIMSSSIGTRDRCSVPLSGGVGGYRNAEMRKHGSRHSLSKPASQPKNNNNWITGAEMEKGELEGLGSGMEQNLLPGDCGLWD